MIPMNLTKPILEELDQWRRGRVKFLDYDKNYGFVLSDDGELFVHRNWLREARSEVLDGIYVVALYDTENVFVPDQYVLYRFEKHPRGDEAHDVVDELSVQMVRRELRKQHSLALALWKTLKTYRVSLVKDDHSVTIFTGNNLRGMDQVLRERFVSEIIGQPHGRLVFEVLDGSSWTECEDPR